MKVLYFGDGEWATNCLKALIASDVNLVGVVLRQNPTSDCLEQLANHLKLPVYKDYNVNSSAFCSLIGELGVNLNVSMSFDQKIKEPLLSLADKGFINCHAGNLPYYRGRSVINWAIINNESFIGLTIHYMDSGYDTGDIILQEKVSINVDDDYQVVLYKVIEAFPALLVKAIKQIENNTATRTKQSHLEGTYFPKRMPGDEVINWHDTSLNIYNFIRALAKPAVGATTYYKNRPVKIWEASFIEAPTYIGNPGQVIQVLEQNEIKVKTLDSHILLKNLYLEDEPLKVSVGSRFLQCKAL